LGRGLLTKKKKEKEARFRIQGLERHLGKKGGLKKKKQVKLLSRNDLNGQVTIMEKRRQRERVTPPTKNRQAIAGVLTQNELGVSLGSKGGSS